MGRGVVRAQRKPYPLPAMRRRRRKPAPCLRCAPMCPMSPRAAGEGSLGLCAGGGLAGDGGGVGRRGAGLECARAPRPMLPPSLPPTAPQTEGGARNAPRPALMLRFHPRFLTILIPIPADMNNVFRWVKYKLVEVVTHLNGLVNYIHLLGRVTLNMNICRLS